MRNRSLRLALVLCGCLALWEAADAAARRYTLAFDRQEQPCLPWRVFLIDRAVTDLDRFSLVAFRSLSVPYFADGRLFVKFLAGRPGDQLQVSAIDTTVAGTHWGPVNMDYARFLGREPESFARNQFIPQGQFAVLTSAPGSFDSRYWGLIHEDSVVGKAIPLW